jgi:ketosteroid isomerase-like protein
VNELFDLERAGWQALVDGTAADFYRAMFTDDALLVVPGMVMEASAWVASLQGPQWSRFELDNVRVLDLADDCRALLYRAVAQREGEAPYEALVTSTYRRVGDRWKLALHQQTPTP